MAQPKTITTRQDKRLARGPVAIGALSERFTKPALGKLGFAGGEIIKRWPEIVGSDLAGFAAPLEVKFPRGKSSGATLLLRIANGAAATMLQFKTPLILERVNRFFGYTAIKKVQAVQGPLPRVTKTLDSLENLAPAPSTLAEALERLGATVQQRTMENINKVKIR